MRKNGGTFRWGKSLEPWTFSFSMSASMEGPTGYAYQVERAKFDSILLNNARKKGVEVRERYIVDDVILEGDRVVGVRALDVLGQAHTIRSKYVADASGNTSRVHSHVAQRVYSQLFRNVALYGYYLNGKRLPSPNQGNILSAAFDAGWFWYIPLSDTLTSVGAVVARQHADEIRGDHEAAMAKFISACPIIREYLSGATRVTDGQYGAFRVRKDYSYCCTRFWRAGMVLVGDAACFVDPVFSSGVHLATYSALLAARSINSCLSDGMQEAQAFDEFQRRYLREYSNFYRFLVAFYNMDQDQESYFWHARKVLNSEEKGNEAFVRLVAGIGSSGEPLSKGGEDFFGSIRSVSDSFVRAQRSAGKFEQHLLDRAFMADFTRESAHIQAHALLPGISIEQPLWDTGLVPTGDGLRWCTYS
jgi:FAD-dependent halogenase